jgi:hypothetical protein
MPTPQQHPAAPDNDAPDPLSFAASVPPDFVLANRLQPELRAAVARSNVDVGRLIRLTVLVRVEEEAVRTEAVNRGHADLAEGSTGSQLGDERFAAAYPRGAKLLRRQG